MNLKETDRIKKAYIKGIFEVLILLNEDSHGREFYLIDLELKNKQIDESLKKMIGNQYEVNFHKVENFKIELEKVYVQFCQNFLYKVKIDKFEGGLEEVSKLLNNEYLKELFVNSIVEFSKNAFKIEEVQIQGDYLYGLPYKGFVFYKEDTCYFLHFGITS